MKRNRAPDERPLHALLISASVFFLGLSLFGSPAARATQACINDGPCADVTTPEERSNGGRTNDGRKAAGEDHGAAGAQSSQGEDAEHGPEGFQSAEASGEAEDEDGAEESNAGAEGEGAAEGHDTAENEGISDDDSSEAGESDGDASQTGNGSHGAG